MKFKKLFEPTRIRGVLIKNRIAVAPMNTATLCEYDGTLTQRVVNYYLEFAKGGAGLIITTVFKVENEIERLGVLGSMWPLVSNKSSRILHELVSYVHSCGSKIFAQLSPGLGRYASEAMIDAGYKTVSSSSLPAPFKPSVMTRELTAEEIERMVEAFGHAATIVATAEADGVEVHGHEGLLLDQFTTAIWNRRTDEYGGDLKGRLRFSVEILEAIKDAVGKDFPVTYRYGLKHFIKGPWSDIGPWASTLGRESYLEAGRDIPEGLEMAKLLEKAGYDGLHVDSGCVESLYWAHPPMYQPHGCNVDLAAEVKKVVKIPVVVAGRLDIPEVAERVLEEGKADIIAIGRGLLADPFWPKKVQGGKIEDIRPCIGCQDACLGPENVPLSCSVNPSRGRERLYPFQPVTKPKRILIAGGGLAGMEVARVATLRGHKVTLYEKNEKLGGHLIEAQVPDFKQDLRRLLAWYTVQLKKLKVEINLKTEVTPKLVREENPDVVIIATGSTPIIPDIPGINKPIVATCCDLLLGKKKIGDKVVVAGGGLVGCEAALWLAEQGKNVTVVEMLPEVITGIHQSNRSMLLDLLAEKKVQIMTNTKILEVTDEGIIILDRGSNRKSITCDTVALAIGLKPETALYGSLVSEISELYAIGDCKEPRKIHHAIWDAFAVGYII